jgi:hypothetical protein
MLSDARLSCFILLIEEPAVFTVLDCSVTFVVVLVIPSFFRLEKWTHQALADR